MENMDKSTLMKLVFGFTIVMFVIIFFLILSTKDIDNNENNSEQNEINNSETNIDNSNENEEVIDNAEEKEDFTFDFQRIKNDSSCLSSTSCDFIIGTVNDNNSTKLLGYKRENNKHSILLEDDVIYEEKSDFTVYEFISFKDIYLIILMEKEENRSLTLLDKKGNKLLGDEYIKSDIYLEDKLTYKSLNCTDGYIYENEIKIINGKPKIIIDSSSGEKSSEKCS